LEGIYFLSELRSFRSQELESLLHHGEAEGRLEAQVAEAGLFHDIRIRLGTQGKTVQLNGKAVRPFRRLRKILPMVLFVPDSVRLFRASPSERRTYFDGFFGLLSDPFAAQTAEYARALRQKQALIEPGGGAAPWAFEAWEEKLAELGAAITRERMLRTRDLEGHFRDCFRELSDGAWETELRYRPHLSSLVEEDPSSFPFLLKAEMERRRDEELRRGQVLVGPHRDDWVLTLGERRLKEEGSQGQHRIAVAALKLAVIHLLREKGLNPLALFDDLLSELDATRSLKVLKFLSDCRCQVFLTSVAPEGISFQNLPGRIYRVQGGKILENPREI